MNCYLNPASLHYTPNSFEFGDILINETESFSHIPYSFSIWNTGDVLLNYSISSNVDWIDIGIVNGSSSGSDDVNNHSFFINISSLDFGSFEGSIIIDSNAGSGSINIAFNIVSNGSNSGDDPVLCFSPGSFDFGTLNVGDSDSTSFDIWNCGSGILEYTVSESCDWLSVNPSDGSSTGELDKIEVFVETDDLVEGDYFCNLLIESVNGSGIFSTTLDVVEIVTDEPILSVEPNVLDFGEIIAGSIRTDSFDIVNDGTGTLEYELNADVDWLGTNLVSGNCSDETDVVTIYVNTSGLSPGFFVGNISIISNGGVAKIEVRVNIVEIIETEIKLLSPKEGFLYIGDIELVKLPFLGNLSLAFGPITLKAVLMSGVVSLVNFLLDDEVVNTSYLEPFEFTLDVQLFGLHSVGFVAYDDSDNVVDSKKVDVLIFNRGE
jgi:hypothetical protein